MSKYLILSFVATIYTLGATFWSSQLEPSEAWFGYNLILILLLILNVVFWLCIYLIRRIDKSKKFTTNVHNITIIYSTMLFVSPATILLLGFLTEVIIFTCIAYLVSILVRLFFAKKSN